MTLIDWKRNNKVCLRNFSESQDLHDVVKTLLVRMLRRKHPDNQSCQIYTELNIDDRNENYPDIQMLLKRWKKPSEIYVYEIQKEWTENWELKQAKKYEDVNLIVVKLDRFKDNMTIEKIKSLLSGYVV